MRSWTGWKIWSDRIGKRGVETMKIALKHGGLTALVDTMGGELVSLRDAGGTEYIWDGDPAYWSGRNPILFPIVGALKDGTVRIGGKSYQMERHGFARRMEFAAAEQGGTYAELELRETAETLARYPFPFLLRVRHEMTEDGFFTEFRVTNTGTAPMPFCIGAHTAFRCPLAAGEKFEDYCLVFERPEDTRSILPGPGGCLCHDKPGPALSGTEIRLDHRIFDQVDTLIYDGLRSKTVSLRHDGTGRGVRVDFSEFPMVAFWTMPGVRAPYICIEPWQGCAAVDNESGDFTDKPYCAVLTPGESRRLRYTVSLLGD